MLAIFHGAQTDFSTHRRHAGRVNHHVDQIVADHQIGVVGKSDLAGLHRSGHGRRIADFFCMAAFPKGDLGCLACRGDFPLANGADNDARHMSHLGDDIGSHFAGADQAYADGLSGFSTRFEIVGKARQRDIGSHTLIPPRTTVLRA